MRSGAALVHCAVSAGGRSVFNQTVVLGYCGGCEYWALSARKTSTSLSCI